MPEAAKFEADWLSLREPVDHASVAEQPLQHVLAHAARSAAEPFNVLELGAGTGSHLRFLAPRIAARQHWTLAERDPSLLALAAKQGMDGLDIAPLETDIHAALATLPIPRHGLVTASALLDLVSESWLQGLVARIAALDAAAYFRLSVSGAISFEPAHAFDRHVVNAFNADQDKDKGFGPALGPAAAPTLASALEARGYDVVMASASWRLGRGQHALVARLLAGYAEVALAAAPGRADRELVGAWRDARMRALAQPGSLLHVGHWDLAATPYQLPGRNPR